MAPDKLPDLEASKVVAAVSELGLSKSALSVEAQSKGGECYVVKLRSCDGASLAVRIPHSTDDSSHDDVLAIIQSEIRIFQILEAKGFHWAPKLRGATLSFDNPIQHPFLVLDWIEGETLHWGPTYPSQPLRKRILGQLALLQLSLLECTQESESITATAYFERRLQNRRNRVLKGKIPGLTEADCVKQQALLSQVLGPDQDCTIFAVHHGDIKPANIIVDENYDIKCLIDWGFAQWAPLVRAVSLPRFLWLDPSDVSGSRQALLQDRRTYIEPFYSQTSQAAACILRWQDVEDVDFRTFYLESISSKGMHLHMARLGWESNECHGSS